MKQIMTDPPLAGLTILDLTRVLAGPYCTMLAGDMGARVIKIEHPDRGDDTRAWGPPFLGAESAYFLSVNRNKESLAIDFKSADGRQILERLIAGADVLVENFRPRTLNALGLGFEALSERHPRMIYVSISGFGQTGPRRDEAGYDAVIQGEGGLMSVTGMPQGPPVRLGVAVADLAAGMFAFQGMLLALIARGRTGLGQLVDVALLDSVAALLTYQASRFFATGEPPHRTGNRHTAIAPYDTFDTSDGVLILAVGNDDQWRRLCGVLHDAALAQDERFRTNEGRVREHHLLHPRLERILRQRPAAVWVKTLRAVSVPCGSVRSLDEVLTDPQLVARAMIAALDHPSIGQIKTVGPPVHLSSTPAVLRTAPPRLGEHTRRVLAGDLGLDQDAIASLETRGMIRCG
jgi:crotonobetainyl-CoA:carnitine CoA-transferase CaiB-like acyl-CoA transferase